MTGLRSAARTLRRSLKRWEHFGFSRYCPCCRSHLKRFAPYGLIPRPEAMCPRCLCLERHRSDYLFLEQKTDLFDGRAKRMLHVAPEQQLSSLFREPTYIDYISGDLMSPTAMIELDVTDIRFPNDSFDVIYCSHVLEHVSDDRRAMREFYRVLKPGRWSLLQVPITADHTIEDVTVTDPEERERLFGQRDHVRLYGPDYKDRLTEAGFLVNVEPFPVELGKRLSRKYGLLLTDMIYHCRKI